MYKSKRALNALIIVTDMFKLQVYTALIQSKLKYQKISVLLGLMGINITTFSIIL